MKEVLSQSEIDNLINSIGKGEIDLKTVGTKKEDAKKYDFRKPNKLSHDQSKALAEIHHVFSRLLIPSLSTMLRTFCTAQVQFVEEQTYYEYINSLPSNSIVATVPFITGNAFIEFSSVITNVILDKILGGKGDQITDSSAYSDIEYLLMKKTIKQIVPYLNDSWSDVVDKAFREDLDINNQHENMYSPNEITIIISVKLMIGQVEGYINICIPYMLMEPVIKKLSRKNFSGGNGKFKDRISLKEYMGKNINHLSMEVKGVLGSAKVSFDQAIRLKEGDVIKLDKTIDKGIDVYVESIRKYKAMLGTKNGCYAVKIFEMTEEEEA